MRYTPKKSPPTQTLGHDAGVLLPAGVAQRGVGLLKTLLQFDGGLARGVGDILVEKQIGDKEVVGDPRVERVGGGVGFVVADGGHFAFDKVCIQS